VTGTVVEGDVGLGIVVESLRAELDAEERRKDSLEKRGLAVVTTSATLVTAVLAFSSWAVSSNTTHPPAGSLAFNVAGILCFTAAAAQGLRTNSPQGYERLNIKDVEDTLDRGLKDAASSDIRILQARNTLAVLASARRLTTKKAKNLRSAVMFELLAVASLSGSVLTSVATELLPPN
jgi:hypothetical protein